VSGQGHEPELETLRHAWEERSRDLVETRVGLAQAVAALTEELAARRAQCEALRAEIAAVREHAAAERAVALELARELERLRAELARVPGPRTVRYATAVRRLIGRVRPPRG
jgi:chromosome segregation ATPase